MLRERGPGCTGIASVAWVAAALVWSSSGAWAEPSRGAVLSARLLVSPGGPVLPGAALRFYVSIRNTGASASAPGVLSIRFIPSARIAAKLGLSSLQSEAKPLSAIRSGATVRIDFKQSHPLAAISRASAYEWIGRSLYSYLGEVPLGRYQAVVRLGSTEKVIGERRLYLALYYRPDRPQPIPTRFGEER